MTRRTMVIGSVLALLVLPVVVVLIDAVSFHLRNRTNRTLVSSGEKRDYLLYVPESYDASRPAPLIISIHGAATGAAFQRDISGWNRLADQHGFIVVYPSGTPVRGLGSIGRHKYWHVNRGPDLMQDVRFIAEMIDSLEASYNIDPARIYANGLSNGGGMSFVLSCTLSDRIAAVGMVGAAQTLPWNWCTDPRPVPMISFHGTADTSVPYHGGSSHASSSGFPSTLTWTANWARRNRCGASPVESVVAPDVTRLEYTHCAGDASVVLYTIEGGGHTWPGGKPMSEWFLGTTSNSIDATNQMWAFFRAHPLETR